MGGRWGRGSIIQAVLAAVVLGGVAMAFVIAPTAAGGAAPWLVWIYCLAVMAGGGFFGGYARRDPVGFMSLALPTLGLLLLGAAADKLGARIIVSTAFYLCAVGWSGLAFLGSQRFWDTWSHYVLRRPAITPAQRFDRAMSRQLRAAHDRLSADVLQGPYERQARAANQMTAMMGRLRSLAAPDAEWSTLRDDSAAYIEAVADCLRRRAEYAEWLDVMATYDEVQARLVALRARGSAPRQTAA